jgi:hypothetical protein
MFEDQMQNNQNGVPTNLPVGGPIPFSQGEPSDMFAESDKQDLNAPPAVSPAPTAPTRESALSSGVLRPVVPPPAEAQVQPETYNLKEPTATRTLVTIIVVILVLSAVGALGWWVYGYFMIPAPVPAATTETTDNNQAVTPTVAAETPTTPATEENTTADVGAEVADEQILFGAPIDKDGDGLDDSREAELGTNPNNWDTDGDGLGDGDEVLIWKTDPLNPDSDGDGYLDGVEVKNGYNPAGLGKIFSPPAS